MSQTYTIHKDIIHSIFKKLVNADAFTKKKNAKTALQLIINSLDETAIEGVASLMLKESVYDVLSIGDYVEVEAPVYHVGSEYEEDVLSDMGLLPTKHGYVYGKEKKVKYHKHTVNPLYLKKISKYDIPYYRIQEEANYKQHVDSLVDSHLGPKTFQDKIESGEFQVVDYDVNDKQPH